MLIERYATETASTNTPPHAAVTQVVVGRLCLVYNRLHVESRRRIMYVYYYYCCCCYYCCCYYCYF